MTRARWSVMALAVIVTLVAERVVHHESKYWFSGIPGFFALFGFLGCIVIIYASKWFGRVFVQRDEDYYHVHGDEDPHEAMSRPHRPRERGRTGRPRPHSPAPPRGEEQ